MGLKHSKSKQKEKLPVMPPVLRKRILRAHGASAEIAKIAGVDRSAVSHILHGRRPPSRRIFRAIVKYLDLAGERLMTDAAKLELEDHHYKL